jgi:hypothetical protein
MNASGPQRFGYAQLVVDSLRSADAFADLKSPLDVEVIPTFSDEPDNVEAWLIFEASEDAQSARDNPSAFEARANSLLIDAGYPAPALETFVLRFASVPEIEERGGRFAFFR